MLDSEIDILSDQPLEQVRDVRHNIRQVEDLRTQGLLARKGEQLPGQIGRAIGVVEHLLNIIIVAVTGRMAQQHKITTAENCGQYIVEIMRNSARQLTHGLHLGGLRHLCFQFGIIRPILHGEQHRSLPHTAHTDKTDGDMLIRSAAQTHRNIARARPTTGVAANGFAQRSFIL